MALLLHAAIQPPPIATPTAPVYPYGNYHAYYGYRLASAFEEDARLKVVEQQQHGGTTRLLMMIL